MVFYYFKNIEWITIQHLLCMTAEWKMMKEYRFIEEEYSNHSSSGRGDNAWFMKWAWKQRGIMVPCNNRDCTRVLADGGGNGSWCSMVASNDRWILQKWNYGEWWMTNGKNIILQMWWQIMWSHFGRKICKREGITWFCGQLQHHV